MKYSVELGICESYGSHVGQWYTLLFEGVEVPDAEIDEHTEQQLEDYLLCRARVLAEQSLSNSDITIAHYFLYAYNVEQEEPA